jgi:hypothetical protein
VRVVRQAGISETALRGDVFGSVQAKPDDRASAAAIREPAENSLRLVRQALPAEEEQQFLLRPIVRGAGKDGSKVEFRRLRSARGWPVYRKSPLSSDQRLTDVRL